MAKIKEVLKIDAGDRWSCKLFVKEYENGLITFDLVCSEFDLIFEDLTKEEALEYLEEMMKAMSKAWNIIFNYES